MYSFKKLITTFSNRECTILQMGYLWLNMTVKSILPHNLKIHEVKEPWVKYQKWATVNRKLEFLRCWADILSHVKSDQISPSVVSDSLRPHESQHPRPPCPSPTPRVHSDSGPSSQWCHPAISSSVVPSPLAPNPSQHQSLFQWVNSSHEVAKVLEFQL